MNQSDYIEQDAVGLAELISSGETHETELLALSIAQIEATNPAINAVSEKLYDYGRAQIERGLPIGPLRGVPFLLKDAGAELQGQRLTSGSRILAANVSTVTSTLVKRYLAAGLVIVGRTTTSEFALLGTVENTLSGITRNPWDINRSTGGSSGGAAAAVAARMVPAAHGSDGGGSIRIPAAMCGVIGLKPSRGRMPVGPLLTEIWAGLSAPHILCRTVRDTAAFLDATHGPEPGDAYAATVPARSFLSEVGAPTERMRIGVMPNLPDLETSPETADAARVAGRLCEDLGHSVDEIALPISGLEARRLVRVIMASHVRFNLAALSKARGREVTAEEVENFTWLMAEQGRSLSAEDYLGALREIQAISRKFGPWFRRFDVVITPTTGAPPQPLGFAGLDDTDLDAIQSRTARVHPFTQMYNFTGQPAMSLPLYWTEAGLPVGVQFASALGEEAKLLRLAAQIEASGALKQRYPPIALSSV